MVGVGPAPWKLLWAAKDPKLKSWWGEEGE